MKKRMLGDTGIVVTECGMGVLPIGREQYNLTLGEGAGVIVHALESGINFLDTAEMYETYPYIKAAFDIMEAKDDRFRSDDIVVSSKSMCTTYAEMKAAIAEARICLGRNTIDIFLMHEVRTGEFAERSEAWRALLDAKKAGTVKAVGVSTHHIDVVEELADVPECDVIFALLNYKGMGIRRENEAGTAEGMEAAIRKAADSGKGVYTMKAFGGGNLTTDYQTALSYAFGVKGVSSVMIGFAHDFEIDDFISFKDGSMDPGYNPDVSKKRMSVCQSDCLGCGECIKVCASGAISFSKSNGLAEIDSAKCLTCGYCAYACPSRAIILI